MPFPEILRPLILSRRHRRPGFISEGDAAEVLLPPGLLGFLMQKGPEGEAALAARTHPMSGIPFGVAVEAAIQAAGGPESGVAVLRAATLSFEAPIPSDQEVVAIARVIALGERHVKVATEVTNRADERLLLRAELILVRPVGGRADRLEELRP